MTVPKHKLILYIAAATWLIIASLLWSLGVTFSIVVFSVIFSIIIFFAFDFRNPAHLMWMVGFLAFVLRPVLVISDLIPNLNLGVVFSLFAGTLVFLVFTETRRQPVGSVSKVRNPIFLFSLACLFAILLISTRALRGVEVFIFPLILIFLQRLLQNVTFKSALILMGIFFGAISIYTLLFWNGYGRLIIFSWLIFAAWIFWLQFSLRFGKIVFLAPAFLSDLLPGVLRRGLSMREQYLYGNVESNLSPILLTMDIANHHGGVDWSGLGDQLIFFFLTWVPRSLWPDKPFGFGFDFVVRELPSGLMDAGHSIAATFLGEHVYFIGEYGYFSVLLAVLLVAVIYKAVMWISPASFPIHFILALYIPTFVWGGLGAYSARAWIGVIPAVAAYCLYKLLQNASNPFKPFGRGSRVAYKQEKT